MDHESRGEFGFFDLFDGVGKQIIGNPNNRRDGATH